MYKYIKRFLDIIFSVIGIIILFIPMIIISIIIKIENKGPMIYKQLRTGYKGKNFYLYKFRTMHNGKITKIGEFIRKTSIDELPQLINIIKGEMSLIGPRPWIIPYYKEFNDEQKRRVDVLPGLTGLAQVTGRNSIGIKEKLKYDLYYIDNYSFLLDLKIFFLTIKTIISHEGYDASKKQIQEELNELKNGD